jgi:hypothetical protein
LVNSKVIFFLILIKEEVSSLDWTVIVSVAAALSGIILGWLGRSRTIRQDMTSEASRDAKLQSDMDYIKRGVDEVRFEQKDQGRRFDALSERVTRVEESAKQAHLRINRLEDSK